MKLDTISRASLKCGTPSAPSPKSLKPYVNINGSTNNNNDNNNNNNNYNNSINNKNINNTNIKNDNDDNEYNSDKNQDKNRIATK